MIIVFLLVQLVGDNHMIFKSSKGFIKIKKEVWLKLQSYRQIEPHQPEGGGVLLGRIIKDSSDVVIDAITVPMKQDICQRYFFHKNLLAHQKLVSQAWDESGGTIHYLGEWHTHPEKRPTPSIHDLHEWKRVLQNTVSDVNELFFVIIGTETTKVWSGCLIHQKIVSLDQI